LKKKKKKKDLFFNKKWVVIALSSLPANGSYNVDLKVSSINSSLVEHRNIVISL
jgi:hypothetical protein